mmetsp:Transcript_1731/g.1176  ORF Transcript_1731/g.1176 Transcript_1731/m.1176 type:complete len:93 (+) Transcript_1731:676-954(+)|eukprot:CAMPEP_0116870212 /NCGR_PEP_ID=MMETSP0463-20121206/79_1 /TAXON_ID=181622 /ORGANISM="Strombidinopsis sp, Strain SopsisLIS2011" /LENGTH=92 /DNA_ID=CAMNT_0004506441 /DNA_START=593 /DNA_END=871 /DNA_ORIENTATION=+
MRSGATFTKVNSATDYTRITGTSIGVSLFWGIARYMNYFKDPTEAVNSGIEGDTSNIDISVGDIYGGNYASIGLPGQLIASSFGKLKDMTPD